MSDDTKMSSQASYPPYSHASRAHPPLVVALFRYACGLEAVEERFLHVGLAPPMANTIWENSTPSSPS